MKGFTLLETVIALAILAMTLVSIHASSSLALQSHVFSRKLTVATLLARDKMTDLEQELFDNGFSVDDQESSGSFEEAGFPSIQWKSKVVAPKTAELSPDQALSAIFGIPLGGDGKDPMASLIGGLSGNAGAAGSGAAGAAGGLGAMSGLLGSQFSSMISTIGQSVREVRLVVSWKDGNQVDQIDLVTHVVSLGQNSDRNGGAPGANAAPGAAPLGSGAGFPPPAAGGSPPPGSPRPPFGIPGLPPMQNFPFGKGGAVK